MSRRGRWIAVAGTLLGVGALLIGVGAFFWVEAAGLGLGPQELEGVVEVKWQSGVEFRLIVRVAGDLVSVRVDDVAWFTHEVGDDFGWTSRGPGPGSGLLVYALGSTALGVVLAYVGLVLLASPSFRPRPEARE